MLKADRRAGPQTAVRLAKPGEHFGKVDARTVDMDERVHPALGIPVDRDGHIQPPDARVAGQEHRLHRRAERMGDL